MLRSQILHSAQRGEHSTCCMWNTLLASAADLMLWFWSAHLLIVNVQFAAHFDVWYCCAQQTGEVHLTIYATAKHPWSLCSHEVSPAGIFTHQQCNCLLARKRNKEHLLQQKRHFRRKNTKKAYHPKQRRFLVRYSASSICSNSMKEYVLEAMFISLFCTVGVGWRQVQRLHCHLRASICLPFPFHKTGNLTCQTTLSVEMQSNDES